VPCEVVLLDISMPGVNGLEAIARIRALNNPPAILVLGGIFAFFMTRRRSTTPEAQPLTAAEKAEVEALK